MSKVPMWLPPLEHQHDEYTTRFTAAQVTFKGPDSFATKFPFVLPAPHFAIKVNVRVGFYPDSEPYTRFDGLDFLTKTTLVRCDELISSPAKEAKKILKAELSELGVPFKLHHVEYFQKHYGERRSYLPGKNWFKKFQNFLRSIMEFCTSIGQNIVPLNLTIDKWITIPSIIHEGWIIWYVCSKRLHPDFEDNYEEAISRPRTKEELMREHYFWTADQIMFAVLKDVRFDSDVTDKCPICLEELSRGEELKSLYCGHAFHDRCIYEWFERSSVCPLCRDPLPFKKVLITEDWC